MSFWKDFSPKSKLYEIARTIFRQVGELDPFVHLTARKSAAIFAATDDTAQRLYRLGAKDITVIAEACLYLEEIDRIAQASPPPAQPIRFISMGRLLHWKGFHLGVRAFAQAGLADAEYWILGEGAEQARLKRLAKDLGIASQVKFLGRLPRSETLDRLAQAHVLVHPSLHDSGGWVLREAMAVGRPILCLDLGGPAAQVTHNSGIRVPAVNPEQAVQDLATAMKQLAEQPELREQMGLAGKKLVRQTYSWEGRGQLFAELYKKLVESDSVHPSLNTTDISTNP